MTIYNIVAIYAPDGQEGADYWASLHDKIGTGNTHQILIGDFNVTLDPYLDKTDYKTDHSHMKGRAIINSWIENEEFIDAFRYLYPESRSYSWQWDGNIRMKVDKKARLDMTLVTPSLINSIINVEYQFTAASDHASIILELGTDIERQGKGTFRAPPFIQNNKEQAKIQLCSAQIKSNQDF